MKKKVSVLIGTYNRSTLIPRTLDSIFNQSYKNIEIIVIDDCSSDNTLVILEEYKEKYPTKFKYYQNESNKGIAYNSNKAFDLSQGDYLALVGDDDFWKDQDKIMKQIEVLESDSDVGVVGTWWTEESDNLVVEKKPLEPINWKERVLSGGGIICGSTALIRKEAWLKVNGFDIKQKRGTDSDLFRRIILSGYKGKVLYEYTTVVDANLNRNRMTNSSDKNTSLNFHIDSMKYNLQKLSNHYDEYPNAKSLYYEKIGTLYKQKYALTKKKEYYSEAIKYFKKSLKIKVTLKRLVKYILLKGM